MKKFFIIFPLAIALITPAAPAHAFLGSSCGAASVVQGAVSQAVEGVAGKIGNSIAGGVAGGVVGGVAGGEVPVKDDKIRNNTKKIRDNTNTLVAKECIGDPLAFALKEGIIAAITQSIVYWINSGFEGGPSFVTNFEGFLGEIADNVSLDFIRGSELGFICSPFQLDIRAALAINLQQSFRHRASCTLGDITRNAEAFLGGDFSQGGWPAWFRIHIDSQNNPFGAYAIATAELDARIRARQDAGRWEVTVGGGFFSKKQCTTDANGREFCQIITPGAQINAQLAQVLGSGFRQLELADEIDEIVNALIAQLSQQALTGLDGLRGLSNRSSSSSQRYTDSEGQAVQGSYLEALVNDTDGNSVESAKQILMINIESALDMEDAYQGALEGAIAALQAADGEAYSCLLAFSPEAGAGSANRAALIVSYKNTLDASRATTDTLLNVRDEAARAATIPALNGAADAYDGVIASGVIHPELETVALLNTEATLEAIANDSEVQEECAGISADGTP